ncbi:hypothetical protein LTR56_008255 [Elasticomyces elasticus]|nr:hypothetical protein LTR56_008255 [Elasticomyces elasticus]KAK3661818.1 hypothetical protein LTR22_007401 [Elasticomyces elasticus]KAK4924422.1 hypothetical protein LTR49_008513 [Elasticomyces elasticus]KAK5762614.1 hypothetical protein LTS12_007204 [Elasticomyces elasticus]
MDPNLGLARETPHLMTLPQEMLDMIFESAFAGTGKINIISKPGWDAVEKAKRRAAGSKGYNISPFPVPKVQEFLVCKSFFVNAANAYLKGNVVHGSSRNVSACGTGLSKLVTTGIGRAWLRSLECEGALLPCGLSGLRSLVVVATQTDFSDLEPWEDDINEADFRRLFWISTLLQVRGVQHFELRKKIRPEYVSDPKKRSCWERNIQRLDTLVRSKVFQPKAASSGSDRPGGMLNSPALYPGSLVSSTGSKLLSASSTSAGHRSMGANRDTTSDVSPSSQHPKGKLTTSDIPSSIEGLKSLLDTNGMAFVAWVNEAKKSMQR